MLSGGNQNGCIVLVVVAEVENQFRMRLIFTSKTVHFVQKQGVEGKYNETTFGLREAFISETFSKKKFFK